MIVVEGVDNSGKSTLIKGLMPALDGYLVQSGEGPPKYPGEQNERVKRYLRFSQRIIFDRHPCVSQPIYCSIRANADPIDNELIDRFYDLKPLFIYCDGGQRGMEGHTFNPDLDTPEHLKEVAANYPKLLIQYRHWAAQHAFINYRIGDSIERVIAGVIAAIR
jgi:hypothetical protein